jgi:lysylphosphatidylglycerol synthetase-like protein (DUF2156 family)
MAGVRVRLSAVWILPAVVLAFASACADLVAMLGHDPIGIWTVLPAGPVHGHWLGVEVSSVALFMTAVALIRRKPLGFVLATIAMIAAIVVHGLFLRHPIAATVAAALAIVLFATRERYGVASDAHGARLAIVLVTIAWGVVVGAWVVALRAGVHGSAPLRAVAEWLDLGTASMPGSTPLALAMVGAHVAIIAAIVLTLTPAEDERTPIALDRARRALARYGRGALLPYMVQAPCRPFALEDGRAALAYAAAGRTAVAVGDPAGESEAVRASFDAWACRAADLDWIPVVYQATEHFAIALERTGWHAVKVGSEAILDPVAFDLATPQLANVRHTVTRSRKGKLHVAVTPAGSSGVPSGIDADALVTLDRRWSRHRGPALGFTVGSFDPHALDDAIVAVASGESGTPVAFVVLRRTGADGGWMLDLMRREASAVPGGVEACLVAGIEALGRTGVRRLSLGLAPLSGLDVHRGPVAERLLGVVATIVRPVYDVEGLAFFKDKFGATWEPRYLVVAHRWQLPAAAIGLLRLHLGGTWLNVGRSLAATIPRPRLRRGSTSAG